MMELRRLPLEERLPRARRVVLELMADVRLSTVTPRGPLQ